MTQGPSEQEEAYFKKQELERLKHARKEAAQRVVAQERETLKQLHWMRCPKCGLELAEVDFRGVTVDACFGCEGMFFDHGEIDKILDDREPGALGKIVGALFGSK